MRATFAAVSVTVLALAAGTADAGFTPAWSYLSPTLRTHLAQQLGGTLYLPARSATGFRYRTGARVANGVLTVPFTQRVRIREGVYRWTSNGYVWQTRALPAGTACTDWLPRDATYQVGGNKVYWSRAKGVAWRCVTTKSGNQLVLSASSPVGTPSGVGSAIVVASGLDVAGRSNAPNVALTVTPRSVHRGHSVLVQGVAGGCTSGDTVTILSHAFPATHSFAGVPAAFARVGSAGRFSTIVTIPRLRLAATYTVTARCGGGNLGVEAHLTVLR
jgi:hypothetical protein